MNAAGATIGATRNASHSRFRPGELDMGRETTAPMRR